MTLGSNPVQYMDSDEVDIGTFRDLGSSWVPPHLDTSLLPPKTVHRGLASPSVPDFAESAHQHALGSGLNRVRSFSHLRNHSAVSSEPTLPVLDDDQVACIRRWMLCIAVVDFDLDVGPVLEYVYPTVGFSSTYRENIAFSSFPDSTVFETGSQAHSFKFTGSREFLTSNGCPAWLSDDGFIYGYACFVQRRDSSSKRGYLQRSIVILSHLALPSLFEKLVMTLAPLYLSQGSSILEKACQDISGWPHPSAGSPLKLGFLGSVVHARLPHNTDELQFPEASPRLEILASLPSSTPLPLTVFSSCLPSLWSIWEVLILCEPILVFGMSPRITSLAVWWLRDFIRPIIMAGDFRPYMTIHDQDYTRLFNRNPPKPGLVVGVTNPFILSATKHWPHVLSLGWGYKVPSISKTTSFPLDMSGSGPSPGFVSQSYKRVTSKDRPLLKKWECALKEGDNIDDACHQLRRHFASRTASFLAPLNRYLNSLIPSPAEASGTSLDRKPRMKPFIATEFLISLKRYGTPLPFRSSSKQQEFYEKWLRTPSFALWLAGQQEIVTGVLDNPPHNIN